jgi:ankyrin repeat protein
MMAAASNGKHEVIRLLIERGADIKKKDDREHASGGSAIDVAAAHCHQTIVRELLDKGAILTPESFHIIHYEGHTPLQALSQRSAGSAALARLLLENGANVDASAANGPRYPELRRPLQLAAEYGDDAILQVLLEYGADVNHRGSVAYTALYLAIQRKSHSLASISALLSVKGININAKSEDPYGDTALHMAAKLGKLDILEILLDNGTDINATNTKAETALIVGATCAHGEKCQQVIHILLARGADIEAVDEDGNTALMAAAKDRNQSVAAIQFLVERGAETSTRNLKGSTALMIAADYENILVVEWLLQCRTSHYAEENGEVWSAVESATRNGHVKTARVLLESLSKTAIRDHRYVLSAALSFEYSKLNANSDMISLLAEYGATVAPLADESNTPHEFWVQEANGVEGYHDAQELFYTDPGFQFDYNSPVDDNFKANSSQADATFQADGDSQTYGNSRAEENFQMDDIF